MMEQLPTHSEDDAILQPYEIQETPPGGPPFHHDILTKIIEFASADLETLKALSAVRRSWRFFATYHPGWKTLFPSRVENLDGNLCCGGCCSCCVSVDTTHARIQFRRGGQCANASYQTRDDIHRLADARERQEIYQVKQNPHSSGLVQKGLVEKVFGWNPREAVSIASLCVCFALTALFACFTMSIAGYTGTPAGRTIFQRRGEDEKTGFNDGQVYLSGWKNGRTTGVWLRLRLCNGYVEEETNCYDCECSDDTDYRRQSQSRGERPPLQKSFSPPGKSFNNYTTSYYMSDDQTGRSGRQQEASLPSAGNNTLPIPRHPDESSTVVSYYGRRSGSCRCCSTSTYWYRCTNYSPEDGYPFTKELCPELVSVAQKAVEWSFIFSVMALSMPVFVAIFGGLTACVGYASHCCHQYRQQSCVLASRTFSLFVLLPLLVTMYILCCGAIHFADRIGRTQCGAWEALMSGDGTGTDGIKTKDNDWSTTASLRALTVPLVLSLITMTITFVLNVAWFIFLICTRPAKR